MHQLFHFVMIFLFQGSYFNGKAPLVVLFYVSDFVSSAGRLCLNELLGHSGQIGNAPNLAVKKLKSMLQMFSMHI